MFHCVASIARALVRMEKLHHALWIVHAINVIFGPIAAAILRALGREVPAHGDVIPDYLAIIILLTLLLTAFCLLVRSRLSVENPGKLQIVLEDALTGLFGMLDDIVGTEGAPVPAARRHARLLIWASN